MAGPVGLGMLAPRPAATGDFSSHLDPELAALALLGPIIYRRFMSRETFNPEHAADLVDTVLGYSHD